jgi:hypothetical protein
MVSVYTFAERSYTNWLLAELTFGNEYSKFTLITRTPYALLGASTMACGKFTTNGSPASPGLHSAFGAAELKLSLMVLRLADILQPIHTRTI